MNYVSTRNLDQTVTAAQAIARGIAQDGGLFCPTTFPKLTDADFSALLEMRYPERAVHILGKFLTDFSKEELQDFAQQAYQNFDVKETVPVVTLPNGMHILELWHGPTCAFKDMALQILPHLLTASLRKTGEERTCCILVATSGDTGKAALEGFADVSGTEILVYYPVDGVSPMQKLQMVTQEGKNVQVVAIAGNFDDAQSAVKQIFTNPEIAKQMEEKGKIFSSANSINWGRLVPQIVYYVSAYCDLWKEKRYQAGTQVNVCVPTGNFGNILAAYIAKQMGVPFGKLICASNRNHVLTDFLETGIYNRNRPFYTTDSPSMDILISSNLERLLFYISGQNVDMVKKMMEQLAQSGTYTIPKELLTQIQDVFAAGYCDDVQTANTIAQIFESQGYLADPHTAVAMHVASAYQQRTGDTNPILIASTASPFKFCKPVAAALGNPIDTDGVAQLEELAKRTGWKIPKPLASLAGKPVRFTHVISKDEIASTLALFD